MLAGVVMVVTAAMLVQDTTTRKDSVPPVPAPLSVPAPLPPSPPPAPPTPTIEQVRYMEGLKTVTRGVSQIRDGLSRVSRAQQADSATRRNAARRLGGLCTSARSFIVSGRPKMQATAYEDSVRILAKQLTTKLDSLTNTLPACEKTAAKDSTVAPSLTTRLKSYDDALLAFRTAQAALYKVDSTKTVSQQ
jgi:hypothetical protein